MKRFFLILVMLLITLPAVAQDLRMLFWYPGEAGSAEDAQPVLDAFFEYLSTKLNDSKITGIYENSSERGLRYVQTQKPALILASHAAYIQSNHVFNGGENYLTTLPYPKRKAVEIFYLVSLEKEIGPNSVVYTSQPMTWDYLVKEFDWNLPKSVNIITTPNLFTKLKFIGQGKEKAFAILTPIERYALKNLKMDWAKKIDIVLASKEIPAPKIRTFSAVPPELRDVLIKMSKDKEGKEILHELRLAGFGEIKK
ncbi:hypothetical protein KKA47_02765 [bacterium]|nr:hypothetical protein [bacterium]